MLVHSNSKVYTISDEPSSNAPRPTFGSRKESSLNRLISSTPDLSSLKKLKKFEPAKPKISSLLNIQFPNDENFTREVSREGTLSLSLDGVGGTYLVKGRDKNCIAVFKPGDEEAGAPSNPKKKC